MAKRLMEGLLVERTYIEYGKKIEAKQIGLAIDRYDAEHLVQQDSEYYGECPFEWNRKMIENGNGIAYSKIGEDKVYTYTITKCTVIAEGA